ncbi:MAG: periplasmic heavy metal sensor [Deltaproteobacteria bacterium]|nr:periplasmic heavy metal sensor [Deltaproteobacteria bacterium]MBI3386541.1 periplasmic heavy metal sensor [Deltaproteobacteria bacterium]
MTKRKMLMIGLVAVGIYAAAADAQPIPPGPPMEHHHEGPHCGHMKGGGPGRLIHLLLRSTDLTADQETQAHQILDAGRVAVQDLFTQLHQADNDLANLLLGAQDVLPAALTAQQALITQLQQQLAQHEAATVLAIRAILTPEQLAQASAALSDMEARHADESRRFGNGG